MRSKKPIRRVLRLVKRLCKLFYSHIIFYKNFLIYHIFYKKKRDYLANLKDIHKGKRVFIVATGPSLTIEDLELIKNEYSISFNGIVHIFDRTTYRPSIYMIQDGVALNKLVNEINKSDLDTVFVGVGNRYGLPYNLELKQTKIIKDKAIIKYYLNSIKFFHAAGSIDFEKPENWTYSFSDDFSKEVGENGSVIFSAVQLAIYLGFKDIYLLGVDCTTSHFYEDGVHISPNQVLLNGWEYTRDYIKDLDVRIYNCSRGGVLECFPRKFVTNIFKEGSK